MPKLKHREPNGRYQRERHQEFSPTNVARLRSAALRETRLSEWASQIGRLYLWCKVSSLQYSSAKRWAAQAAQHHHALGCHVVRSARMEKGIHSHPPDPDSERGREQAEKDRRDRVRFEQAAQVLEASGCRAIVDRCVLQDEAPAGVEEMEQLKRGLTALAQHWGLAKKNGHAR